MDPLAAGVFVGALAGLVVALLVDPAAPAFVVRIRRELWRLCRPPQWLEDALRDFL